MAKRQTKAEREAAEKAALRARLKDIACGAYGGLIPLAFDAEEFAGLMSELGADAFGRFVGGVENALLDDDHKMLGEARYLEHYDDLDKLADMLWRNGVRG